MFTDWNHIAAWLASIGAKGMPHVITETITLAAAPGEVSPSIKFAESGSFLWTHGLYSSDNAAVAAGTDVVHGGAKLEIKNPAGRGALDNGQLFPINALFGRAGAAGEGPRALPMPFLFNNQTNLNLRVVNDVAGVHVIKLVFIGVKTF